MRNRPLRAHYRSPNTLPNLPPSLRDERTPFSAALQLIYFTQHEIVLGIARHETN
jgi:hypothetical protein